MKNENIGTLIMPSTINIGTASYTVPGLIKREVTEDLIYKKNIVHEDAIISESDDDEVTHTVFFGENIRRVLKAFKK